MKRSPYLVGKVFRKYLAASVLTVAASQVASIIDASIVGNLLGDNALAAINVCKPMLQCIFALSVLIVGGGSMLTGMAKGKGDTEKANGTYSLSIGITAGIAAAITVAGAFHADAIAVMLCKSEAIRPMASDYLRVMMLSALPMMLMTALDSFVTLDGEPGRATAGVIAGNVVNLALDILFVKYLGWGMTGAALATCIMYFTAIAVALPHFTKKDALHLSRSMEFSSLGALLKYGFPLFIGTLLLSVQFAGTNLIAARHLGDGGLVTYAVCMQILTFSMVFINGNFRTVQPVGAVLKGMDDGRGLQILLRKAYSFLGICLAVYSVFLCIFPGAVAVFFGVTDPGNAVMLRSAIPVFTIGIILQALLNTAVPFYQLCGRTGTATFISVGQSIFPLLGFWYFSVLSASGRSVNPWLGFAAGHLAAALVPAAFISVRKMTDREGRHSFLPELPSDFTSLDFSIGPEGVSSATAEIRKFLAGYYDGDAVDADGAVACAEELLNHSFSQKGANAVDIKLVSREGNITISMCDDGAPFNPAEDTAGLNPELEAVREFCIKKGAASISYRNLFNQNFTSLRVSSISRD